MGKQRPKNKRPVRVEQINTRCAVLVVGVFREVCRRRGVSQRAAMEDALQAWCGVKVPGTKGVPADDDGLEGLL